MQSLNSYISRKIESLSIKINEQRWKKRLQDAGIPEAEKIFTYTTIAELRALYNLASNCSQNTIALEIGSHLGASTCFIAAGLRKVNGHLFCIDTWNNETMPEGEQDTFAEFQKNIVGVKKLITPVKKRSEILDTSDIEVPLDFTFIDGDHSYEAVKLDFEKVVPWVVNGGIIAFHDCLYFEGVSKVIGEALATGNWRFAGSIDNLLWIRKEAKSS